MGVLKCSSLMLGLCSLLVAGTAQAAAPICLADLNNDGEVDGADLGVVLTAYGANRVQLRKLFPSPDLHRDGSVNGLDLQVVTNSWGPCVTCPSDLNGDGTVDSADLASLLSDPKYDVNALVALLNSWGTSCATGGTSAGLFNSTKTTRKLVQTARNASKALAAGLETIASEKKLQEEIPETKVGLQSIARPTAE
jgi:hypothetical protein